MHYKNQIDQSAKILRERSYGFWSAGNSRNYWKLSVSMMFIANLLSSCGSAPDTNEDSHLQWSQSRPNNPNYAYLHQEDLERHACAIFLAIAGS